MEDRIPFQPVIPQEENQASYESHVTDKRISPLTGVTDGLPIVRQDIDLFPVGQAFLLYNVLSKSECQYYIDTAEKFGLESVCNDTAYRKDYRNNDRVVVRSNEVADLIWQRIRSHLTDIEVTADNNQNIGPGYNIEGRWQPQGLNETWRICKYVPGGHFAPHYDGNYIRRPEERSMKTFMLYLNDGFEGGSTNFVDEKQLLYKDPKTGIYCAEEKNILLRIVPKAGMAIIFNHHLLHEGEQLGSGVKYIMRSDIMFLKVEGRSWTSDKERQAVLLLQQAEHLETEGKVFEAQKLYEKAFRLWPPLERTMFGSEK